MAKTETAPAFLGLDELADKEPIRATAKMPPEIEEMTKPRPDVFIRSKGKPTMDFRSEHVNGSPDMWQLLGNGAKEEILTAIPGVSAEELQPDESDKAATGKAATGKAVPAYRPDWLDQEFLPKLVPFRLSAMETGLSEERVFMEPRAVEAPRLAYPWCTVGRVITKSSAGTSYGSGVLVGPNLMLTAGHCAPPPGAAPNWSMEFIPAYREGDPNPTPYGSSFVEMFRGYRIPGKVFGYDYVICKLRRKLGQATGTMGARVFPPDRYADLLYTSSGYPSTWGGRQAVEYAIDIKDVDSDNPGIQLETRVLTTGGWSGGPLWFFDGGGAPMVVGVLSGAQQDFPFPEQDVYAGYNAMMELILYGYEHWQS